MTWSTFISTNAISFRQYRHLRRCASQRASLNAFEKRCSDIATKTQPCVADILVQAVGRASFIHRQECQRFRTLPIAKRVTSLQRPELVGHLSPVHSSIMLIYHSVLA